MNRTITKADIVEHLHDELGLNKSECKQLVEDFFQEIRDSLINNEAVKLSGFGNFELIDKMARPGRNPKTGEDVTIKARRVVTFRAGNHLRQKIASEKRKKNIIIWTLAIIFGVSFIAFEIYILTNHL